MRIGTGMTRALVIGVVESDGDGNGAGMMLESGWDPDGRGE